MRAVVPESWNDEFFQHTHEGPDDMPGHVKSTLLGCGVAVPVAGGSPALGGQQRIQLNEHRDVGGWGCGHSRRVQVTELPGGERRSLEVLMRGELEDVTGAVRQAVREALPAAGGGPGLAHLFAPDALAGVVVGDGGAARGLALALGELTADAGARAAIAKSSGGALRSPAICGGEQDTDRATLPLENGPMVPVDACGELMLAGGQAVWLYDAARGGLGAEAEEGTPAARRLVVTVHGAGAATRNRHKANSNNEATFQLDNSRLRCGVGASVLRAGAVAKDDCVALSSGDEALDCLHPPTRPTAELLETNKGCVAEINSDDDGDDDMVSVDSEEGMVDDISLSSGSQGASSDVEEVEQTVFAVPGVSVSLDRVRQAFVYRCLATLFMQRGPTWAKSKIDNFFQDVFYRRGVLTPEQQGQVEAWQSRIKTLQKLGEREGPHAELQRPEEKQNGESVFSFPGGETGRPVGEGAALSKAVARGHLRMEYSIKAALAVYLLQGVYSVNLVLCFVVGIALGVVVAFSDEESAALRGLLFSIGLVVIVTAIVMSASRVCAPCCREGLEEAGPCCPCNCFLHLVTPLYVYAMVYMMTVSFEEVTPMLHLRLLRLIPPGLYLASVVCAIVKLCFMKQLCCLDLLPKIDSPTTPLAEDAPVILGQPVSDGPPECPTQRASVCHAQPGEGCQAKMRAACDLAIEIMRLNPNQCWHP
ncbi:unnamed protein product [Prorocentrum cordatum]|uniref:Uncharacterized protein n=1 Tax=Prorocentrum cordatum TaxID=2364126 RepID=A0ABN9RM77_9DINO|nr:unnamed protein product [Polarella glacialis]